MKYEVLEEQTQDGFYIIKLLEAPYKDATYSYGAVSFGEGDDEAVMSFEYDVYNKDNFSYNVNEFETCIGDILVELIKNGIAENSIIYSGGDNS